MHTGAPSGGALYRKQGHIERHKLNMPAKLMFTLCALWTLNCTQTITIYWFAINVLCCKQLRIYQLCALLFNLTMQHLSFLRVVTLREQLINCILHSHASLVFFPFLFCVNCLFYWKSVNNSLLWWVFFYINVYTNVFIYVPELWGIACSSHCE